MKSTNTSAERDVSISGSTAAPLPNFLGIGAERAATTWLHNCLSEHPDVFVPDCKEVGYFANKYEQGLPWYREHFAEYSGQKAAGEITPSYLTDEAAMPRIMNTIPEARLFLVLRNPVERAFSAYQLYRPRQKWKNFADAISKARHLVERGLYAKHLDRIYQHVAQDQLKVFLYEDVQANPHRVLTELFRYLGVNDSFEPQIVQQRYNRVVYPKAQSVLRRLGMGWMISLIKQTPVANYIKRNAFINERPSQTDIDYLQDCFRADIVRLQRLIDRDLSSWLTA